MAGTGTHDNPFVVTTYSELAQKITNPDSLSECYIKVGNDINIADEYPFGDMPVLDFGVNVFLDGDGKTITNWYCTNRDVSLIKLYSKNSHPCCMKNLNLANIVYSSSSKFVTISGSGSGSNTDEILIDNCTFVGEIYGYFMGMYWTNGSVPAIRSTAFNLLLRSTSRFISGSDMSSGLPVESCNFKIVSEGTGSSLLIFNSSYYPPQNSYFDISIPNGKPTATSSLTICDGTFSNCVIKLSTPAGSESTGTKPIFGHSNSSQKVSIINLSAATGINCGDGTQLKEVTDQNWHDIAYLQSIGFSAGERT
jgi:hypothetical protein